MNEVHSAVDKVHLVDEVYLVDRVYLVNGVYSVDGVKWIIFSGVHSVK